VIGHVLCNSPKILNHFLALITSALIFVIFLKPVERSFFFLQKFGMSLHHYAATDPKTMN